MNLEIAPGGDLSNVNKAIWATSQAQTKTTFITTGTTITSAAISGPKTSTTSSITPSSATSVPMSSTLSSTYNDVDKAIEFSQIEKAKSYQQQNQMYITEAVGGGTSMINPHQSNAHQNGNYGGPLLSNSSSSSSAVVSSLKNAVDSTPVELQQSYRAVNSVVESLKNQPVLYAPGGVSIQISL